MTEQKILVLSKPELNPEIVAFYTEALRLLEFAEARVIQTNDDLKPATDDLSIIAKVRKGMEEERKKYLAPFQNHVKETNDAYKQFMSPIEQADKITRDKILAYDTAQRRIRVAQEEINRKRIEAAQEEMKLKGELTESVNLIGVIQEVKRVSTEMGTSGIVKIRKWEVEDLSKVPLDYLMIDAAKVGKVVKAGIPFIQGIRIWLEASLRVTTK